MNGISAIHYLKKLFQEIDKGQKNYKIIFPMIRNQY